MGSDTTVTLREGMEVGQGVEGSLPLQGRHEVFAQHRANGASLSKAYLAAGYKATTNTIASSGGNRLMKNARVATRVAWLQVQVAALVKHNRDEVLAEIDAIGFSKLTDVMQWGPKGVTLLDSASIPPEAAAAVQEVVQTGHGRRKRVGLKMHSKVAALSELARIHGLHPEQQGVSGVTVVVIAPPKLSRDEWMKQYADVPVEVLPPTE